MRRLAVLGMVSTGVLIASAVLAPPALAGDRFAVQLVDDQIFGAEHGTFTSNIPGCTTGNSYDVRAMVQETPGPGVFRGTRMFVCDQIDGSVMVNLSARFGDGSVGSWSIVGTDDDFAAAHGAGKLVGTSIPGGIQDTYTGTVTITG